MAAPVTPPEFYIRLESFARSTGLSLNVFGQKMGFGSGVFSRVLRDQVSVGVNHLIHLFTQYPDLNPRWLLLGEAPMRTTRADRQSREELEMELLKMRGQNEALREVVQVWSAKLKEANRT